MKTTAVCILLALGLANVAVAQSIQLPGRTIDVNQSSSGSSAQIDYGNGAEVNATQDTQTGTSTVNTPGRSTTITPDSVETTLGNDAAGDSAADSAATGSSHTIRVDLNGREVQVSSGAELSTYRAAVVEECQGITRVESSDSAVQVSYRQPAKFLGLFSSSLSGTIEVTAGKQVSVKLPWYSFLFSKDSGSVKTSVESAVVSVSSTSLDVTTQAAVISIVAGAVSDQADACGDAPADSGSAPTPTATPTPASSAPTATPTPVQQSQSQSQVQATGLAQFVGDWNGSWAPNAALPAECGPGGAVSMSFDASGTMLGYAVVEGDKWPGTGKVDAAGNLSGSWNYNGNGLTFSGKFNMDSGKASGSYQNKLGCFGTFSLGR